MMLAGIATRRRGAITVRASGVLPGAVRLRSRRLSPARGDGDDDSRRGESQVRRAPARHPVFPRARRCFRRLGSSIGCISTASDSGYTYSDMNRWGPFPVTVRRGGSCTGARSRRCSSLRRRFSGCGAPTRRSPPGWRRRARASAGASARPPAPWPSAPPASAVSFITIPIFSIRIARRRRERHLRAERETAVQAVRARAAAADRRHHGRTST